MNTGREEFVLAGSALSQPTEATPADHAGDPATATRAEEPAPAALPVLSIDELRRGLSKLDAAEGLDLMTLAQTLYQCGYFKDDITKASQAVVKILAGRELGLPAIQSMSHLYLVDGKVALEAAAIDLLLHKAGYAYDVKILDERKCVLEFYAVSAAGYEARRVLGTSSFTMEDAQRIKVYDKGHQISLSERPIWKSYPRNMLRSRALSNGARWFCGAALGGVYTKEELE